MDPRVKGIELKLKDVRRIISVVSGKGGVGKSLFSTALSLALSREGHAAGLLDLDFYGASDHVILGFNPRDLKPEEDQGVIPPEVKGVKFMSIVYYTEEEPIPMRGKEVSDALIELLAITRWDSLDFLVIDMPPGLGEQFLDLMRFIPRGEYIVITTPSSLSTNVATKVISVLKENHQKILGLVENMGNGELEGYSKSMGLEYLGHIPKITDLEKNIGRPESLLGSEFGKFTEKIAKRIISQ